MGIPEHAPGGGSAGAIWSTLSGPQRWLVGGGLAAAALSLVLLVQGWDGAFVGALLLAGAVLAALPVLGDRGSGAWPVDPPTLATAAGWTLLVLAILAVVELLFDLDQLETISDDIGAVVIVLLFAAALGTAIGLRRGAVSGATAVPRLTPANLATPGGLATTGLLVLVVGWIGMVSISVWALEPGALLLVSVVVATVAARRSGGFRPAIVGPGVLVVAAVYAAILTFDELRAFLSLGDEIELGLLTDWLPFLLSIAGLAAIIGAAVLAALSIIGTPATMRLGGGDGDGPAGTVG